jgi:hypothetical protein
MPQPSASRATPTRRSSAATARSSTPAEDVERGKPSRDLLAAAETGQFEGSAGNVIAALASLFILGLGQLLQGRLLLAIVQFVVAGLLWIVLLGWAIHLWSALDAALWKSKTVA